MYELIDKLTYKLIYKLKLTYELIYKLKLTYELIYKLNGKLLTHSLTHTHYTHYTHGDQLV